MIRQSMSKVKQLLLFSLCSTFAFYKRQIETYSTDNKNPIVKY